MPAQPYPPLFTDQTAFLHGADYNPDQWLDSPQIIDEDFRLLPLAGMNSWTLGIFAWAALEPEPGVYRFDWMQQILDRAAAENIAIILATPSGSKPAWLSQAHPEVCRVNAWQGPRLPHGGRHNHCPSSQVYRDAVTRIDTEIAQRFGAHPAVKLWHLSNEYNGECRCPSCLARFRVWLKDRYGSLEALNAAWWNAFWSHQYNDWEQIHPFEHCHDGMTIDWRRFVTDLTVDFLLVEKTAVRAHSTLPVTTNMMGHFPGLDYWRLAPHLDVISNDCYPRFNGRGDETATMTTAAFDGDLMRCLGGGRPWLLMESTPAQLNWAENFLIKRPGVHRREMHVQIGSGADGTCYFQWRKGRGGSEKYHGAVVDHAGHDNRVFAEVADYGHDLAALAPVLGSGVAAEVALLEDWQMRWGLEAARLPPQQPADKGYMDEVRAWYQALRTRAVSVDLLPGHGDPSPYRLLIVPMGYQITEELGRRLETFVTSGGILLTTYLTGHCDASNRCHLGGFPGAGLQQVLGIRVEEMDGLPPGETVAIRSCDSLPGLPATAQARDYCEVLHCTDDTEVLACYDGEFYAGSPVLTRRRQGAGWAYHLAARCEQSFLDTLVDTLVTSHDLPTLSPQRPEAGVWIQERSDGQQRFLFVHNATTKQRRVQLHPGPWRDLISGETVADDLVVPGIGTRALVG